MPDKTPEWLKEYNDHIGSSRAAGLMGKCRFLDPLKIYRYMRHEEEMPDISGSPDVRRGTMFEPVALQLLKEATAGEVVKIEAHPQDSFQYHQDYPWANALPDVWATRKNGEEYPIEVKWPRPATFRRIQMGGLLPENSIQGQHQLAILDEPMLEFCICCCVTLDIIIVPVERDDTFIADMMQVQSDFMSRVKKGLPPSAKVAEVLPEPPKFTGEMTYIKSDEAIAAARAWIEARSIETDVKELMADAVARLKAVSGAATTYEIQDGDTPLTRHYKKTQVGRATFDRKSLLLKYPDLQKIIEKFESRGNPFQTFKSYRLTPESE